MKTDDADLTLSRIIRAPRAAVWNAWTDPKHFERWWIPAPTKCRVLQMELRPGGPFETQMSEDDGPFKPHLLGCFLNIVPEEKIVFTTALTGGWRPADDPFMVMTAIITMADEGDATRYAARVLHRNAADSRKHEEMGFEDGWGTVIDQLAEFVKTH